ncbi:MAG: hypothetical protein WC373_09665 [Smithella sp.]|jgi:hypothetical protein
MKYSGRLAKARQDQARLNSPAPDYPKILPDLRRSIVITDYDFGEVQHRIDLYRTGRRDCYRAVCDGQVWRARIGWSRVLEMIRKSFIRVGTI